MYGYTDFADRHRFRGAEQRLSGFQNLYDSPEECAIAAQIFRSHFSGVDRAHELVHRFRRFAQIQRGGTTSLCLLKSVEICAICGQRLGIGLGLPFGCDCAALGRLRLLMNTEFPTPPVKSPFDWKSGRIRNWNCSREYPVGAIVPLVLCARVCACRRHRRGIIEGSL